FTVHGNDRARARQLVEQIAEAIGPEGGAGAEVGRTRAGRARLLEMLLQNLRDASLLEQRQVGQQRRRLPLEARRCDVEKRAAANRDDWRIRADHEAIAWQRDDRRLEPE